MAPLKVIPLLVRAQLFFQSLIKLSKCLNTFVIPKTCEVAFTQVLFLFRSFWAFMMKYFQVTFLKILNLTGGNGFCLTSSQIRGRGPRASSPPAFPGIVRVG